MFHVCLGNGTVLDACFGYINLPIVPMCNDDNNHIWSLCFKFQVSGCDLLTCNILGADNQDLLLAQKKLLLWHHGLSH